MALDQLREDQSQIVHQSDEAIANFQQQVLGLQEDIKKVQQEKAIEKAKAAASAVEVTRLKGRIDALQYQIDHIIVSSDPDRILDDLQQKGFRIRRRLDTR